MRDVAAAAGVSKNAVSLALRNDPQIPLLTRRRIEAAAARVGYRRNPVVSELMSQLRRSGQPGYQSTLALLNASSNPDAFSSHPTIPVYVAGCRARAEALGYALDVFWLEDPTMPIGRLRDIFLSRGIRGAVLVGLMDQNAVPDALRPMLDEFPVVVTGVRTRSPALHFACVDHHIVALRAIQRAVELGYERPGLAIDPTIDRLVEGRFTSGFLLGQQELPARQRVPVHALATNTPCAQERFLSWVEKKRPDAILCLYNSVTRWLESAGIRVPADVGFVQLEWRSASPEIAGMNQHNDECGAAAIDMLISLVQMNETSIPAFPKATLIGPTWVDGPSLPRREAD